MAKAVEIARVMSEIANRISGVAVLLMILLIVTEVCMRKLFNLSTNICDEYTGYFQATVIFMTLAQCFLENRHINVDLILRRLPDSARRWIVFINNLIALAFVLLLLYAGWHLAWSSFVYGSTSYGPSNTPLFIPQAVIVFGLVVFAIQICLKLFLSLAAAPQES